MLFSELRQDMVVKHHRQPVEYHVEHLGKDHAVLRPLGAGHDPFFVELDHPLLPNVSPNGLLA